MINIKILTNEELNKLKKTYELKMSWYAGEDTYEILECEKPLALIEIDNNEYEFIPEYTKIDQFEVLEKSIGIGTIIITDFIRNGYKMCLYSEDEAILFWEKLGFKPVDESDNSSMHYYPPIINN